MTEILLLAWIFVAAANGDTMTLRDGSQRSGAHAALQSILSLAGIGLDLTAREARLFFGRRLPLYFSRRGEPNATTAATS